MPGGPITSDPRPIVQMPFAVGKLRHKLTHPLATCGRQVPPSADFWSRHGQVVTRGPLKLQVVRHRSKHCFTDVAPAGPVGGDLEVIKVLGPPGLVQMGSRQDTRQGSGRPRYLWGQSGPCGQQA